MIKNILKGPNKNIKPICLEAISEGIVMLENNGVLPFSKGTRVSVFGRNQTDYNKSGTGSGGLVNVEYVKSILECLEECCDIEVNQELKETYLLWIKENPFDYGTGWASEPWSQKEMPLSDEVVKKASLNSDVAVVVISRTSGEDRDNNENEGSYLLSKEEDDMIKKVCENFSKVCVLLNVGNIIDMKFVKQYNVGSLLYIWQGGEFGAEVIPDILLGNINPSGKLTDTIAKNISDYYSDKNFGNDDEVIYEEDIFVGYRYFETFNKDAVLYPFGFGMSYTDFEIKCENVKTDDKITLNISVKNTGKVSGKEVVQVYYKSPSVKLPQPKRQLVAFRKTKLLKPNETENLEISFNISDMKSYDDSGATGYKSAYVMEEGKYEIFVGNNVRDAKSVYTYKLNELKLIEQLREAMAPKKSFKTITGELVHTREIDLNKRIKDEIPQEIPYTGDKGIKLQDVYNKKNTLEEFIAQLTSDQLICLSRGEGMNSPKVPTPGTGSAFGGLSSDLQNMGIPAICTTDGPSGLRLDGGDKATSVPNGTMLACTFNEELVEKLYEELAVELYVYDIDALLGPGMNIHRHPLNGRNFEYFSEDPYVTGVIGTAVSKGLSKYNGSATIKHFCCNNQEYARQVVNAVVSERALREIYLKGFEMAVKSGYPKAVMTTYNPVNGIWNAGNYDLNTTILRNEWGYTGIVMTDWWAAMNDDGGEATPTNTKAMIRSQNDLYMVVSDAYSNSANDNSKEAYENGELTLSQLQRNAKNILTFVLNSTTFKKYIDNGCKMNKANDIDFSDKELIISIDNLEKGKEYPVSINESGKYYFRIKYKVNDDSVAQHIMRLFIGKANASTDTVSSANGEVITIQKEMNFIKLNDTTLKIEGVDIVDVLKLELYK